VKVWRNSEGKEFPTDWAVDSNVGDAWWSMRWL